jgi:hypothetical protein
VAATGEIGLIDESPFVGVGVVEVGVTRYMLGRERVVDAGRGGRSTSAGLGLGSLWKEAWELLRACPGSFGVVFVRTVGSTLKKKGGQTEKRGVHMNEVGGAVSFDARKAALLLSLGATVGALTDATAIDSFRLCPGTPSNVVGSKLRTDPTKALVGRFLGVGAAGCPILREAARVMRGATTGGAVEATVIVSALL